MVLGAAEGVALVGCINVEVGDAPSEDEGKDDEALRDPRTASTATAIKTSIIRVITRKILLLPLCP